MLVDATRGLKGFFNYYLGEKRGQKNSSISESPVCRRIVADGERMTCVTTSPLNSEAARLGSRVETVHSLRGLAALAVALFHFSCGNPAFYVPHVLKAIGGNGWLGVEVFFVISGFILPYSLWRAGYHLSPSNFGRFVWKRVVRLEPPYFATIALILLLAYLSARTPGYRGEPFHLNLVQIALHIGYLNAFAGLPWLNPAFWTLAIECQFYLLVALIFPLVVSGSRTIRLLSIASLLIASLVYPRVHFLSYYLPLFICGIVAFQWFSGICVKWETALILLPAAIILYAHMGVWVMVIGLATAFIIVAVPSWTNAPLALLGTLSYSLYLLHVPVGGRVINLARRLPPSPVVAIVGISTAAAVSIGAAYVLYRIVERPAQRYAGSLRFSREVPLSK
jgi:peptidoglycan/LPS O-acetylase OafA/YrhL